MEDFLTQSRQQAVKPLGEETAAERLERFMTLNNPLLKPLYLPIPLGIDSENPLGDIDKLFDSEEEKTAFLELRFDQTGDAIDKLFGQKGSPEEEKGEKSDRISSEPEEQDLISRICSNVQLAVELGKHLNGDDILNLYSVSKVFHYTVNHYLLSSVNAWVHHSAPEAAKIFNFRLYRKYLISDPSHRTWDDRHGEPVRTEAEESTEGRSIPGIKFVQFVLGRHRYCSQILALMARQGHLMPPTMHSTLLRIWFFMELPVTEHRRALLRNQDIWTDEHLYNAQMFFIKLAMLFNDPLFGPWTLDLSTFMLGQKGLYPLWQLLTRKKYTSMDEIVEEQLRHGLVDFSFGWNLKEIRQGIHGVPVTELGRGHCEGWGVGRHHLLRPDEAIPIEAVTRGLRLERHLLHMATWGYFDWKTGENLVPSEEEMYIENEEEVLSNVDTSKHWKPRHAKKKHWGTLAPREQQEIMDEEEDEDLRALAWYATHLDYENEDDEVSLDQLILDDLEPYDLDDEIDRGYIVPPVPKEDRRDIPDINDKAGWAQFSAEAMIGLSPEITSNERLRSMPYRANGQLEEDEEEAVEEMDNDIARIKWFEEQQSADTQDSPPSDYDFDEESELEYDSDDEGENISQAIPDYGDWAVANDTETRNLNATVEDEEAAEDYMDDMDMDDEEVEDSMDLS